MRTASTASGCRDNGTTKWAAEAAHAKSPKPPGLLLHRIHDRADDGRQNGATTGAADDILQVQRATQSARCRRGCSRIDRTTAEQATEDGRAANTAHGA